MQAKKIFNATFARYPKWVHYLMEHNDFNYIRGVLANDSIVLEAIYRKYLNAMVGMVRRNNGNFEDAKDVFQEALVVVFHHAARPGFRLTASFQSYLLGIGRFIWLRQLKKNGRVEVTSELEDGYDMDADVERQVFDLEKRNLYREKFAALGADCRQLLQRFFDQEPLIQIAEHMGYTADYIKKKNKVCKEKLMTLIQTDARFEEMAPNTLPIKIPMSAHGASS